MKAIGGHAALFLVVPLTAALLIWCTFAIGRQLGSSSLGLGAAWLVATSPAFLTMIKEPMSDVPAAAFWALATWKVLDDSRFNTALAGLAAAIAILVRPNLVPLAAVLGVWMFWRRRDATLGDRARRHRHLCGGRRACVSGHRLDQPDAVRFAARLRIRRHEHALFLANVRPTSGDMADGWPRRRHRSSSPACSR